MSSAFAGAGVCRSGFSRELLNCRERKSSWLKPLLQESRNSALGLEHRPGALLGPATTFPDLLQSRGMALGQCDPVIVGQLLARLDRAPGLDEDLRLARVVLVFVQHCLAVRIAAVIDPARAIAFVVSVDHVLVVEREQEGVAAVDVAAVAGVDFLVGPAPALVLVQSFALGDRCDGEHAIAVDGGTAGDDLAGHAEFRGDKAALSPEAT